MWKHNLKGKKKNWLVEYKHHECEAECTFTVPWWWMAHVSTPDGKQIKGASG
jgi:hypothetical protein